MEFTELWGKSILILGFGIEGLSTYKLLNELFPHQRIGIADNRVFEELPAEGQDLLPSDPNVRLHLGENYLSGLAMYDVIVKSPGIALALPELQEATEAGKIFTSHTDIFFSNCPGTIIGVTGTKGKGTTSKLIHTILKTAGFDSHLVGNIGSPSLPLLKKATLNSYFVYELSAQQLDALNKSPHIAVVLNVVPDHLDHFVTFENYVKAKQNITINQKSSDYLIYNQAFIVPRQMSLATKAQLIPFSVIRPGARCFVEEDQVVFSNRDGEEEHIISLEEVAETIPGAFNLDNVLPAVAATKVLGVGRDLIVQGIKHFQPLPNRFDRLGKYKGISFYNASIATVPEATIGHALSLGKDLQTMLLGGFDRGLDFSELGKCIVEIGIKNVILFPTTGIRIWKAIQEAARKIPTEDLPRMFVVEGRTGAEAMKEAVDIAYRVTQRNKICLHSPASPSFGLFKDFTERGALFKKFVEERGSDAGD